MLIDAKHLIYNRDWNEYTQELSTLRDRIVDSREVGPMIPIPHQLVLRNCPSPGEHRRFVLSRVEKTDNCISGWFFIEDEPQDSSRPLSVLLIND